MVKKPTGDAGDVFADLAQFRLPTNFETGIERLLLRVPVRRPNRQEFFRIRPEEGYRLDTRMIELAEDREWYLVTAPVCEAVLDEVKPVRLMTCVNRQGILF